MNQARALAGWTLALWLAAACSGAARAPVPSAAELAARQRAAEQAAAQAAEQAAQRVAQALEQQRREQTHQRLAAEFSELEQPLAGLLAALQALDAAGDERATLLSQLLAVHRQLGTLDALVQACGSRLDELSSRPLSPPDPPALAGRVRLACDLAMRARAITERQFLAQVKVFLAVPAWVGDVVKRYDQQGWVAWHDLMDLLNLQDDFSRRAAPWQAAAAALQAMVPDETLLKPGLVAREGLLRALQKAERRLDWPASVADPALTRVVTQRWEQQRDSGPLAGLRGEPLEVRALDGTWQVLRDAAGRTARRQRDFVVLFRATATKPPLEGCWLAQGTVEQQRQAISLRWSDDLRKVACPGTAPHVPAIAKSRHAGRRGIKASG